MYVPRYGKRSYKTVCRVLQTYFKDDWSETLKYEGMIFGLGAIYPPGLEEPILARSDNGSPTPFDTDALTVGRNRLGVVVNPIRALGTEPGGVNWEREVSSTGSSSTTPESIVSNGETASNSQ